MCSAAGFGGNVVANYDYVMNISAQITVPEDAPSATTIMRMGYTNAWGSYPVACGSVNEGMIYDIPVKVVAQETGVEETEEVEISIYPNPANDYVVCNGVPSGSTLSIITMSGAEVMNAKVYDAQQTINIAGLANGLYIVRIYGSEGNIYTGKLVVK